MNSEADLIMLRVSTSVTLFLVLEDRRSMPSVSEFRGVRTYTEKTHIVVMVSMVGGEN
jgi:hypothetical protein